MNESDQTDKSVQGARGAFPAWLGILGTAAILVAVVFLLKGALEQPVEPLPELDLSELKKVDGRFYIAGETNVFSGMVVESYEDGSPKSRTVVADGLLDGLSEGWHSNGQKQISESFVAGVSHGPRTKWWPDGTKQSEGMVADGEWEGLYRKWHENGQLSQEIPMKQGKAHGVAKAWFPSGALKSRVELTDGETVKSEFFEDVAKPKEEHVDGQANDSRG